MAACGEGADASRDCGLLGQFLRAQDLRIHASERLQLVHTQEEGRSVAAQAPIRAGEIIMEDTPYLSVVSEDFAGVVCECCFHFTADRCGPVDLFSGSPDVPGEDAEDGEEEEEETELEELHVCRDCGCFATCNNPTCLEALRMHTTIGECDILKRHSWRRRKSNLLAMQRDFLSRKWARQDPHPSTTEQLSVGKIANTAEAHSEPFSPVEKATLLRFSIRLMLRAHFESAVLVQSGGDLEEANEQLRSVAGTACRFEHYLALQSHSEDLHPSRLEEIRSIAKTAREMVPRKMRMDLDHLVESICREECNAFGMWSRKSHLLGFAVAPFSSMFNHSCQPNCIRIRRGRSSLFVALVDIQPGDLIHTVYSDTSRVTSRAERRAYLESVFHFSCNCARCRVDGPELLEDFHCPHPWCQGYLVAVGVDSSTAICSDCLAVKKRPQDPLTGQWITSMRAPVSNLDMDAITAEHLLLQQDEPLLAVLPTAVDGV